MRSGCFTCKIRRKKCDEAKPFCSRCTSTGRKCDGYSSSALERSPVLTTYPSGARIDASSISVSSTRPILSVHLLEATDDVVPANYNVETTNEDYEFVTPLVPSLNFILDSESTWSDVADDKAAADFILAYPAMQPESLSPSSTTTCSSSFTTHSSETIIRNYEQKDKHTNCDKSYIHRTPNFFDVPITDLESHCFSHFRYRTGPQFAAYFDSTLWQPYSINLALSHPVLFACATAVGAVHRRFTYGISREAFEYCSHSIRLYAKARRMLEELKAKHTRHLTSNSFSSSDESTSHLELGSNGLGVSNRDVIMTSELLLSLFEGFQSNYDSAVRHMNKGMRYLLDRPMKLVHREISHLTIPPTGPAEVLGVFWNRIQQRARELFGSDPRLLRESLCKYTDLRTLPPVPKIFTSLEEARDVIFEEVNSIMHTPRRVWKDEKSRSDAQKLHVARLLRWNAAYAETIQVLQRTDTEKQACMLLKLTRNMSYLLLYLTLYVNAYVHGQRGDEARDRLIRKSMADGQAEIEDFLEQYVQDHNDQLLTNDTPEDEDDNACAYTMAHLWKTLPHHEVLLSNLCRLHIIGEVILNPSSAFSYLEHSCSFDSAIGPPLQPLPIPEASGKTRHLVKNLLEQPTGEDTDAQLGIYGIAEHISAVEEHAVIEIARARYTNLRWIDITWLMEERKLLLRYCSPGGDGSGMCWTQEWWEF